MKKLKLNFSDFDPYHQFSKQENYFTHLLSKHYEVEISENPDLLIYSNYGKEFQRYQCPRLFFTVENLRPDYHECDFSFSFDLDNSEKHYRLPSYCFYGDPYPFYGDPERLILPKNVDQLIMEKKKFCCFMVTNPYNKTRNKFFKDLSKYKKVDSGGRFLNNIGYIFCNKTDFIKDYKFMIAFENESYPGYTTEKIFEPMQVNTIPIYWGNPHIKQEFNIKSFINCHDFQNFNQVIEQIIRIDTDDDLYTRYLKAPFFTENKVPEAIRNETVLKKLISIIDNMDHRTPVSVSRKNYKYFRNTMDFLKKPIVFLVPLSVKKTYLPYYRNFCTQISKSVRAVISVLKKILNIN